MSIQPPVPPIIPEGLVEPLDSTELRDEDRVVELVDPDEEAITLVSTPAHLEQEIDLD